jgi:hypothetical protein
MSSCRLCDVIKNEDPLYEDDECIIVNTRFMKGHHKRVMIISKAHYSNLDAPEDLAQRLMQTLIRFGKPYFDEEPTFAICEPTYCSIPEHWHRIASDWIGPDVYWVNYTPHIAVSTNTRPPSRETPTISKLKGLYCLAVYAWNMILFGVRR